MSESLPEKVAPPATLSYSGIPEQEPEPEPEREPKTEGRGGNGDQAG